MQPLGRNAIGCCLTQRLIEIVKVLQPSIDLVGLFDISEYRFDRLVAITGNADHNRLVSRDTSLFNQLFRDGDSGPTRGLSEDPLGLCQ